MEEVSRTLTEALEAARAIEDTSWRAVALSAAAPALAQAGQMEEVSRTLTEALEAARAIEDTSWRAGVLRAVASALAQAGRWRKPAGRLHSPKGCPGD